jgi:gamma-glutamyltranspeptidase/glutathione hydrolase
MDRPSAAARSSWRASLTDERLLDRDGVRGVADHWTARSHTGVVASAHYRATRAGVEILEAGGNAVDAAVATSLALAVVESAGSGIGGMAIATLHLRGEARTFSLLGPCRAPASATPQAVAASARYTGYRAVAVPTYLSVVDAALRRYGTLSPARVLAPAIALAEDGFRMTPLQTRLTSDYFAALRRSSAAPFFLDDDGQPRPAGSRFAQPVLARTLNRLADEGFRDFYEGEIAARIAADMRANEGFVSAHDLASVPEPEEEAPVEAAFRGARAFSAGFPAGGRTLAQMLHLAEELAPDGLDLQTPGGARQAALIICRARQDRRRFRLDKPDAPDFASAAWAREIAPSLREQLAEPESGETSHLCVVDRDGNAVSWTQSIERSFGAKVVTPDLGFLHNGYMKGFKIVSKRHPHTLRPGAVARSNAAPTLVLDDNGVRAAIGSTGSERMLSSIFTTLLRLDAGADPFEAVHGARLHATPERQLLIEADGFDAVVLDRLRRDRFEVEPFERYSFKFGGLQLIARDGDAYVGVAEPRRDGAAAGPGEG